MGRHDSTQPLRLLCGTEYRFRIAPAAYRKYCRLYVAEGASGQVI